MTGGADVKFSDKVDLGLTGGLDHIFRHQFSDQSVLVIDPSAYVYAGTQQFTNTYYKQSNFLLFPGVQQSVSQSVKNFNVLSYEFSPAGGFCKREIHGPGDTGLRDTSKPRHRGEPYPIFQKEEKRCFMPRSGLK